MHPDRAPWRRRRAAHQLQLVRGEMRHGQRLRGEIVDHRQLAQAEPALSPAIENRHGLLVNPISSLSTGVATAITASSARRPPR